jgi:Superinfection immunity protein
VKWVTALELEQWADRIDARSDLIGIVADLIRASASDINSFRFPSGDSAQLHGWDGRLHSVGAPPYVPQDESAWEFGTASDYVTKINSDYTDRTRNPRGVDPKQSTFVFVTPRRWATTKPTIDEWKNQKWELQEWKDVAVFDAVAILAWKKTHRIPILLLNLLLGWTMLGWVGALIWAFVDAPANPDQLRPRDILSKLREAQSRPGSVLLQLRSPLSGGLAHLLVTISKSGGRAGDPADYHAADELGSPADETARPDGLA